MAYDIKSLEEMYKNLGSSDLKQLLWLVRILTGRYDGIIYSIGKKINMPIRINIKIQFRVQVRLIYYAIDTAVSAVRDNNTDLR